MGGSHDLSAGGSHELDLLLALQRLEAEGGSDDHEQASKAVVNVNRLRGKVMERDGYGDLLPPAMDDMGTGGGRGEWLQVGEGLQVGGVATGDGVVYM